MRRISLTAVCIMMVLTATGYSQKYLSVRTDDMVYHLLDVAYIRGALPKISAIRPFTLSQIQQLLDDAQSGDSVFTTHERSILSKTSEFYGIDSRLVGFDLSLDSELRTNVQQADDYHFYNAVNFTFSGNISGAMSYRFLVAPTFDRINQDTFPPFAFTKMWDGTHVNTETGQHTLGDTESLAVSQIYSPEIAALIFDDRVSLRWAKIRRNWGVGESSLQLSETANAFDAIEGSFNIAPWLSFSFLSGSLGDYSQKDTSQSMISTKRAEFFFADWFYLSLYDAEIWGKRFELHYLNPFSIGFLAQSVVGDMDNVFIGGTAAFRIAPYGQLYFSLMVDDYRINDFRPFANPFWKFAYYGGLKLAVPFLPFTLLTLQYTKIEPWMYTHYPQAYPFLTEPTDISYSHTGENLGYYLPPNSDEFLVKVKAMPLHYLSAMLQYQYIRHGDGEYTLGQVEGDIDKSQRIDIPGVAALLPDKDFLNDAIYEFIHIFTIGADYELDLGPLHLSAGPEYTYVNAKNFNNIVGNDVVKHLIGLKLSGLINVYTYKE